MDAIFVEGAAATISAVIVFVGSVWLLLAMVLGPRLSYFITASITLGFIVIMGVVWSINPLGPVGTLAEWDPLAISQDQAQLDFEQASAYPDQPWQVPNTDDEAEAAKVAELESAATDYIETGIEEGDVTDFEEAAQAAVSEDSSRLLQSGDTLYGMVAFEPLPPPEPAASPTAEEGEAPDLEVPPVPSPSPTPAGALPPEDARIYVVMTFDPGNPLGMARMITAGSFVLLVLHLFGLSRSERRSKQILEESSD